MKKRNLKTLKLNKDSVSSLANEVVKGGAFSDGPMCQTQEPEFCNWTYNNWCCGDTVPR
ncbi:hypothetical protein IMCC3317_02220 [Kordia antarctica]|uniref:Uncharacterized protein n=1 Tax=Kordia antarctica TaxID=1218801 RepID=A0A7L4ZE26_9FLAO|nr:hypothetical protein [Kordia antarctica]QHI34877.1 hypothetical protein IMCC3317_02220 [Kordia antarctica]